MRVLLHFLFASFILVTLLIQPLKARDLDSLYYYENHNFSLLLEQRLSGSKVLDYLEDRNVVVIGQYIFDVIEDEERSFVVEGDLDYILSKVMPDKNFMVPTEFEKLRLSIQWRDKQPDSEEILNAMQLYHALDIKRKTNNETIHKVVISDISTFNESIGYKENEGNSILHINSRVFVKNKILSEVFQKLSDQMVLNFNLEDMADYLDEFVSWSYNKRNIKKLKKSLSKYGLELRTESREKEIVFISLNI
ncbi:MAG: hypothetical protein LAT68_16590 [Cyclobacteriaceae bacterium]|nr:hypothetical protein [Cyclobacteriaceae bacterium]MCH8517921.1 hypothetical protein [Cyclobacteriaceae bacterium]